MKDHYFLTRKDAVIIIFYVDIILSEAGVEAWRKPTATRMVSFERTTVKPYLFHPTMSEIIKLTKNAFSCVKKLRGVSAPCYK
jgi:hypothetical protein